MHTQMYRDLCNAWNVFSHTFGYIWAYAHEHSPESILLDSHTGCVIQLFKITAMRSKSSGTQTLHLVLFVTYFLLQRKLNGDASSINIVYKKAKTPFHIHPVPSIPLLFCLQTALSNGQRLAAAFPLHPLCTGLKSWHGEASFCCSEVQRKLIFRLQDKVYHLCGLFSRLGLFSKEGLRQDA